MAKGNGERPAKKGTPDKLLEELKVAASKPNPPAEVPPRDTDKEDSGISAESIQSEREEDALIDKNIEARRAAEAEAGSGAAMPDGKQVGGGLIGKFNAFVAAEHSKKNESPITPTVAEAVPPELEHLNPEERKTYEKIPAEKRASYLVHVAEMRADKEKKERRSKNKKPVKHRTQKPKAQSEPAEPLTPMPSEFYEPRPKPDYIDEQLAAMAKEKYGTKVETELAREDVEVPFDPHSVPSVDDSDITAPQYAPRGMQEDIDGTPAVFRYNRDRRGTGGAQAESPVSEPELSPTPDGTQDWRQRWLDKLRGTIEGAKEKIGMSERGERMKAYLAERSKALGEKAKEYGSDPEKLIRDMGEQYNKLSFKQKLLFGFGLGAGATIFSGVSTPLTLLFAGGLSIQRAGGMASMYLKFEKHLQDTVEGKSKGIFGRQEWYQNIFMGSSEKQRKVMAAVMSVGYTAGMSAAIGGTIKFASESQYGEAVHDWLRNHYPFGETGASATGVAPAPAPAESGVGAEVPHAAAEVVTPEHPAIPAGHQASADVQYQAMRVAETGHQASADVQAATLRTAESSVTAALPEMPSVEASAGHGYEYMVKRVWEQLQDKHIDPSTYAEGSDIRRLLEADAQSIDKVVHQIAADPAHGFFNADGTSVRIDMGAHMTIGADGQIHLGEAIQAPVGAPVTPAFHPEAGAPSVGTLTKLTPEEAAEGIVITEEPVKPFEAAEPFTAPTETLAAQPETPAASAEASSAEEIQPLSEKEVVSPEPVATVDVANAPEFVSEPHAETPPASAAEAATTQSPAPVVEQGFISNQLGLKIPVAEPHLYADPAAKEIFAYGGSPVERAKSMLEYLTANPNKVVFAADDSGKYRIPWHLVEGKLTPGAPIRTSGLFGLFSSFMKAPEPEEFAKLIK